MKKLRAILDLLMADKYALFTYEEAQEKPELQTAPTFKWTISHKSKELFNLIKCRLHIIETHNEMEE